jgi:carboxymethylenebutenolidase
MREDILSLMPKAECDRRAFVSGALLAAGFALAVSPAAATAIQTDTAGIEAGTVLIPVSDGQMPAYAARPAKGGPFPTVMVVQEIFGVHEHIRDVCRRLAKLGYLAVAPELFMRQGDPSKVAEIPEIIKTIVSKVPDAQVMADLDKVAAWAPSGGGGDPVRLGITGFCWGGRVTWLYAAHNPRLKAAVAWYGRLIGDRTEMTPRQPLDIAAELKVPVLGLYGGADQGIPQDSVERMRAALKAAGAKSEIIVYPDAPHAFHADYRPSWREAPAKDGWQRLQAWFRANGLS